MSRLLFIFFISIWCLAARGAERELFSAADKEVLVKLKSPQFLFEKMQIERQNEALRFFSFILGLDSLEDKSDLAKLDFRLFSKIEDEAIIKESREKFIQDMRRLEEQE